MKYIVHTKQIIEREHEIDLEVPQLVADTADFDRIVVKAARSGSLNLTETEIVEEDQLDEEIVGVFRDTTRVFPPVRKRAAEKAPEPKEE